MTTTRRPELGWTMQRKPFSVQTQTREQQPLLPPLTMLMKIQRRHLWLWMARHMPPLLLLLFLPLLLLQRQLVCRRGRVLPPLTRSRLETSTTC
jgi:hypothetical protein